MAKHTSITSTGKLIISMVGYSMCTCSFLRFMGSMPVWNSSPTQLDINHTSLTAVCGGSRGCRLGV
eukprot:1145429-Pelagomonas_calceolata.AAC.3